MKVTARDLQPAGPIEIRDEITAGRIIMFTEAEGMATKTASLRANINTTFARVSNAGTRTAQIINIRMDTMATISTERIMAAR